MMKRCPFCAEEIQDEAIKCRHCGEVLNPTEVAKTKATTPASQSAFATFGAIIVMAGVWFGIMGISNYAGGRETKSNMQGTILDDSDSRQITANFMSTGLGELEIGGALFLIGGVIASTGAKKPVA